MLIVMVVNSQVIQYDAFPLFSDQCQAVGDGHPRARRYQKTVSDLQQTIF